MANVRTFNQSTTPANFNQDELMQLQTAKAGLEKDMKQMQEKKESLLESLKEAEKKHADMQAAVELQLHMVADIAQKKSEKAQLESELVLLRNQNKVTRESMSDLLDIQSDLKQDVDRLTKQKAVYDSDLLAGSTKYAELLAKINDLDMKRLEAENVIQEAKVLDKEVTAKAEVLAQELSVFIASKSDFEKALVAHTDWKSYCKQRDDMYMELLQLKTDVDSLNTAINQKKDHCISLTAQIEAMQKDKEVKSEELVELIRRSERESGILQGQKNELIQLKQELLDIILRNKDIARTEKVKRFLEELSKEAS